MDGTRTEAEQKLFTYMVGWRTGARGGYAGPDGSVPPDFARGQEDGRKAQSEAYRAAREAYGASLSPLRTS